MKKVKFYIQQDNDMRFKGALSDRAAELVEKQLEILIQEEGNPRNAKDVWVLEVEREKNNLHAKANGVLPLGPDERLFSSALEASLRLGLKTNQVAMAIARAKRDPDKSQPYLDAAEVGGVWWQYYDDMTGI